MKQRTCPSCSREFKRSKVVNGERTCPGCGVELYYADDGSTVLLSERRATMEAASKVVFVLEEHISKRDGLNFAFSGAERVRELALAYGLIERSRAYLERQAAVGVTALQFAVELIGEALSDPFWANVTQSIAMLLRHVGEFAKKVYLRHKALCEKLKFDDQVMSLGDLLSYSSEPEGELYVVQ